MLLQIRHYLHKNINSCVQQIIAVTPMRYLFTAVFSSSELSVPPSTSSQLLCLSRLMSPPLNIQCLYLRHTFLCVCYRKEVKGEPDIYSSLDMLPDFVSLCLVLLRLLELEKTLGLKSFKAPHFTHGQRKARKVGCRGVTTVQWPQSSEVGQTRVWLQPPPINYKWSDLRQVTESFWASFHHPSVNWWGYGKDYMHLNIFYMYVRMDKRRKWDHVTKGPRECPQTLNSHVGLCPGSQKWLETLSRGLNMPPDFK